LAPLEGASAESLFLLAAGLKLADTPISLFVSPIFGLAIDCERGEDADRLTRMQFRRALRLAAQERSLISQLADAEQPFWRAVGDSLTAIVEAELPA
jgi:hypothetical protein